MSHEIGGEELRKEFMHRTLSFRCPALPRQLPGWYLRHQERIYWTLGQYDPETVTKRPRYTAICTSSAKRPGAHFFHDIGAVKFDGLFRGIQPGGDLLVEHAGNNVAHHFALARGERLIALLQFVEPCPVLAAVAVALQRRR